MKQADLEYFIGKICTVFTVPTNRNYKDECPKTFPEPVYHYFMGRVLSVTDRHLLLEQWAAGPKKLRSLFFLAHVIGIAEEEQLNPANPDDAKVIESIKQGNQQAHEKIVEHKETLAKQQEEVSFIDIGKLAEMQKKMGETFSN